MSYRISESANLVLKLLIRMRRLVIPSKPYQGTLTWTARVIRGRDRKFGRTVRMKCACHTVKLWGAVLEGGAVPRVIQKPQ
jgi:hypothetical protein